MTDHFSLTDAERHFLLHWHYEATGPFWGPAIIWCFNHRINPAYGPYPLAELLWSQERRVNRTFWTGHRPWVSFQIPWEAVDHFWSRMNTALSFLPRLQGDPRFTPTAFTWQVEGTLTADETNYLRAYNLEMVQSGSGPFIDLAHQQGVTTHQLIPFFVLLKNLDHLPSSPIVYPWTNFLARHAEMTIERNNYPRLFGEPPMTT